MDDVKIDPNNVCRCCLLESSKEIRLISMRHNTFEHQNEKITFHDGFIRCSGSMYSKIKVVDNDPKICNHCTIQLESAYIFQDLFTQVNRIFIDMFGSCGFDDTSDKSLKRKRDKSPILEATINNNNEKRTRSSLPKQILPTKEVEAAVKRSVKCSICSRPYLSWKRHRMLYHPTKTGVFACEFSGCDKTYTASSSLGFHIKEKHTVHCLQCDSVRNTSAEMKKHVASCHKGTSMSPPTRVSEFKCHECDFVSNHPQGLKIHLGVKHKIVEESQKPTSAPAHEVQIVDESENENVVEQLKCPKCDDSFDTRRGVARHMYCKHPNEVQSRSPESPKKKSTNNTCPKCSGDFKTERGMKIHMAHMHPEHKDIAHKCDKCSKSFPSEDELAVHSFVHKDIWPYHCSECDVQHIEKGQFILHLEQDHKISYNADIHFIYNAQNK